MPTFNERGEIVETPSSSRTERSVRAIVGSSVEIINIDGLEVPLADGSMFYIPFVDVAADAYYTEAVAWAYANDITAGVTELSFGPNQTCTRAQMVTFLWRAAGCPEPTGTASGFSDVAAGSWYEKAVAWAVENKITDGVGDGRFDPNGIVNRAQAVTFLYRAKGAPATTASESFTDVGSGEFYTDAVAWAVANNVTNGVGDNAFAPTANCVRGQTVTFLYRAYK
ncbi:MAG: S-layer homology domain-containing protein [Oscillospiraceae bacterium]|nr:S-layer homology domain-containing protein [Oscillospiraceae bacterium]